MSKPRILLLGADGQLGTELRRSLSPLGEIVPATLSGRIGEATCEAADFAEPRSLQPLVERVAPDIVVNAAAHTAVDRAETERDLVFAINDFDEVHPGPWEWDLKRLAASAGVAVRFMGGDKGGAADAAAADVR